MYVSSLLTACLAASAVAAGLENHHAKVKRLRPQPVKRSVPEAPEVHRAANDSTLFLNARTARFAVNGSGIPDVNFDIGESYAGTLPISNGNSSNQLFFWFVPSTNPAAEKEIAIWLNGGPGCSSLDGFLQENGPFLWQPGTYEPVPNQYSFNNLTNVIYVDQPVGVGFSPGSLLVEDESDVASQFMGFWRNFIDTFSMQGYNVYITGESYAGQYIPYIADGMLNAYDDKYFNVEGVLIIDPSINDFTTLAEVPSVPALHTFNNILGLNQTFVDEITARAEACGYLSFFQNYTTHFPPPPGPFPTAPYSDTCDVWTDIVEAVYLVNPCFNFYHLNEQCPYTYDQLGFPSLGVGPNDYFNRSDVQAAIHAPPTDYTVCDNPPLLFPHNDLSLPSSLGPLPSVIERTNNTIIAHGLLDFLLFANGTLISIQNMTWNGLQGFQTSPFKPNNFYVPYHTGSAEAYYGNIAPWTNDAGAGLLGTTHTERGLTFVTVDLAGHEIPQYSPGSAYRMLEKLLGRIDSLEQVGDYTTQTGNFTGTSPLRRH